MGVSPRVVKTGSPGPKRRGAFEPKNWEQGRQKCSAFGGGVCQRLWVPMWLPLSPGSGRPGDTLTSYRPPPAGVVPCQIPRPTQTGDLLCGHERSRTAAQKSLGRNIPFGGTPSRRIPLPTPLDEISRSGTPPADFLCHARERNIPFSGVAQFCLLPEG